jgi:5-methylcytosine-specific restriction enzyme A
VATTQETLDALVPAQQNAIMDLVAATGVDVSLWAVKADGTAVQYPRANPKYCYQWAFGGGTEPTVLCIWHSALAVADSEIVYSDC